MTVILLFLGIVVFIAVVTGTDILLLLGFALFIALGAGAVLVIALSAIAGPGISRALVFFLAPAAAIFAVRWGVAQTVLLPRRVRGLFGSLRSDVARKAESSALKSLGQTIAAVAFVTLLLLPFFPHDKGVAIIHTLIGLD